MSREEFLEAEGKTEEEFDAEIEERTREAHDRQFVLDKVVEKEQLSVNEQELTEHIVRTRVALRHGPGPVRPAGRAGRPGAGAGRRGRPRQGARPGAGARPRSSTSRGRAGRPRGAARDDAPTQADERRRGESDDESADAAATTPTPTGRRPRAPAEEHAPA